MRHKTIIFCSLAVLILLTVACDRATPGSTTYRTPLSHRVVQMPGNDSVEWQATLPAEVTEGPPGILVEFYPYKTVPDTIDLRRIAANFFPIVLEEIGSQNPAFIVLRAVDVPSSKRRGVYEIHYYAVVYEKRADDDWHIVDDTNHVAGPRPNTR